MKIKNYEEARKKIAEKEQMNIVNWYCGTINYIHDVPLKEINFYMENYYNEQK